MIYDLEIPGWGEGGGIINSGGGGGWGCSKFGPLLTDALPCFFSNFVLLFHFSSVYFFSVFIVIRLASFIFHPSK